MVINTYGKSSVKRKLTSTAGLQHLESVYKHDVLQILRMWLSTRHLKREQLLLGHRRQQPAIRRAELPDRPPVQRLALGRILIHCRYFVNRITDKYPSATSRHCKWGCVKSGLRPKLFCLPFGKGLLFGSTCRVFLCGHFHCLFCRIVIGIWMEHTQCVAPPRHQGWWCNYCYPNGQGGSRTASSRMRRPLGSYSLQLSPKLVPALFPSYRHCSRSPCHRHNRCCPRHCTALQRKCKSRAIQNESIHFYCRDAAYLI